MAGSTGSRILWAGLLAPPLVLLGAAGAVTLWPERMVGLMDAAQRAWPFGAAAPVHAPQGHRSIVRVPPPPPPSPPPMLRGVIRTPDGEPFRGQYTLAVTRRGGGLFHHKEPMSGGMSASGRHSAPEFEVPILGDSVMVAVAAEGYAPAVLGPLSRDSSPVPGVGSGSGPGPRAPRPDAPDASKTAVDPGDPEPVALVLAPGFRHEVRVVDDEGAPILGAEVSATLMIGGWPFKLPNPLRTDEQGRAVFAALSEGEYEFEANVHDYRFPDDAVPARVKPGVSTTIALERGPVSGVALDEEGRPVADALLLLEAELDPRLDLMAGHPFDRIVLAQSDRDGRFRLPALHDESTYLIRAEDPDGSLGFAPGVRRGGGEAKVTLRPMRTVRAAMSPPGAGTVRLFELRRSVPTGFHRSDPTGLEASGRGDPWSHVRVNHHLQVGPDGRFEYPAWGSVDTELLIDGRSIPVPWPPPEEPLQIDLPGDKPPAERTVRIQFLAEQAARPIQGSMTLHLVNAPPERAHQDVTRTVEIRQDAATFRCLSDESFSFGSGAVPGFWTVPGKIAGGGSDGERVADVRVFASGSIAGRVVDADGKPVAVGTEVRAPFDPEWARGALWDRMPPSPAMSMDDVIAWQQRQQKEFSTKTAVPGTNSESATTDAEGRFEIPAFPLDVPTRLTVIRGCYLTRGEVVRLDRGSPRREVEIRLPRQAGASIRVVDPEGRPIPGAPVTILQKAPEDAQGYWPVGVTDADGRCAVDDLAETGAVYSATVSFAADFRPIVAPLTPGGPALELRAERGHVAEGRVVEAVTGRPIPGLTLYARPEGTSVGAEARTDEDGRFRMTTLPEGPVRLEDRRGLRWISSDLADFRTGSVRPAVLRVIDLRTSDPQPRPVPLF